MKGLTSAANAGGDAAKDANKGSKKDAGKTVLATPAQLVQKANEAKGSEAAYFAENKIEIVEIGGDGKLIRTKPGAAPPNAAVAGEAPPPQAAAIEPEKIFLVIDLRKYVNFFNSFNEINDWSLTNDDKLKMLVTTRADEITVFFLIPTTTSHPHFLVSLEVTMYLFPWMYAHPAFAKCQGGRRIVRVDDYYTHG